MNIFYDPVSGIIDGYDTGATPLERPGLAMIFATLTTPPDRWTEKIDLATFAIVPMTDAERLELEKPDRREVDSAIARELTATDRFMMPDRDDIAPQTQAAWKTYRKTLRDLSKGNPSPSEMIASWPTRPDGADSIMQPLKVKR